MCWGWLSVRLRVGFWSIDNVRLPVVTCYQMVTCQDAPDDKDGKDDKKNGYYATNNNTNNGTNAKLRVTHCICTTCRGSVSR